jgi:hypothetical protein
MNSPPKANIYKTVEKSNGIYTHFIKCPFDGMTHTHSFIGRIEYGQHIPCACGAVGGYVLTKC